MNSENEFKIAQSLEQIAKELKLIREHIERNV